MVRMRQAQSLLSSKKSKASAPAWTGVITLAGGLSYKDSSSALPQEICINWVRVLSAAGAWIEASSDVPRPGTWPRRLPTGLR